MHKVWRSDGHKLTCCLFFIPEAALMASGQKRDQMWRQPGWLHSEPVWASKSAYWTILSEDVKNWRPQAIRVALLVPEGAFQVATTWMVWRNCARTWVDPSTLAGCALADGSSCWELEFEESDEADVVEATSEADSSSMSIVSKISSIRAGIFPPGDRGKKKNFQSKSVAAFW